jgi:hypothetical protein
VMYVEKDILVINDWDSCKFVLVFNRKSRRCLYFYLCAKRPIILVSVPERVLEGHNGSGSRIRFVLKVATHPLLTLV